MVLLFRHIKYVTKNCPSINNTDQFFLDLSNKHKIYGDDDDEHLPIPVYSGIKSSMGQELILNKSLSLGRFSTERNLILNDTIRGCCRNAKLICEGGDIESLWNYSNQVMNIFFNNQLVFFQMVNV